MMLDAHTERMVASFGEAVRSHPTKKLMLEYREKELEEILARETDASHFITYRVELTACLAIVRRMLEDEE